MMRTRLNTRILIALLIFGAISARGADEQAEAKAKADYEAAVKAAQAAESAVGPLLDIMRKADKDYADARKDANDKRQKATETKDLAGESGVLDLKKAEEAVPVAAKALDDATKAKPPLDKALEEAKKVAEPLQKVYDEVEKIAKEAEAKAKAAADAANRIANEAKSAESQATAKRRVADSAKTALERARQNEQKFQEQLKAALVELPVAQKEKQEADAVLAAPKSKFDAAKAAYEAAEKLARGAEANAKPVPEEEKKKAEADAVAKRKAADAAQAALTQAQQKQQQTQAAVQKLAGAPAAKKAADDALAAARKKAADANGALQAAEKAAQAAEAGAKTIAADAAKSPEDKKKAADDAAARRKAAEGAKAALAQAQKEEQQAQAQAAAAAKAVNDAPAQKKGADENLAYANKQAGEKNAAFQEAEKAAKNAEGFAKWLVWRFSFTDEQKKQAAADAAAKRQAADAAKAVLDAAQKIVEEPEKLADAAAAKLARAEGQKKAAEGGLESIKKQIVSATEALAAAEKDAQAAAKIAEEKKQVAAQASAKRKTVADAAAALAQAQKGEQDAQAQIAAAAKSIADLQGVKKAADTALANAKNQVAAANTALAATDKAAQEADAKAKQIAADAAKSPEEKKKAADEAAAKKKAADAAKAALAKAQEAEKQAQGPAADAAGKLAAAEALKKTAEAALAGAKAKVAPAITANQAARDAAKDLVLLDDASRQAAADAAAKRKTANEAKAALDPKAKELEKAAVAANRAAQELERAEGRKKSVEEALENLKKRIASAKETHVADDKAAQEAEAKAAPLEVEAKKTREAYLAARDLASEKRNLAQAAKDNWYRLAYARRIADIMEIADQPKPGNRIDEIIFAKLNSMGVQPALCSDPVFVRRAFLDLIGELPTADEAKAFIQDPDKNKRVALVDGLLERREHFDYWAMKWSDILRIKAEFPVKVWPNAAQAYYRYVWETIAQNKPYDQFAREMLTSSGSNYRVGPVNFYRAIQDKTPEGIASTVGLVLMGTRLHAWPEDRRAGMAAFFTQIGYKPTSEWKEEIVFWDPLNSVAVAGSIAAGIDAVAKSVTATNQIPRALEKPISENAPLAAVFPDGTKTTVPPNRDPREAFAEWLIRAENPWFARNIVNRTWAWAMGRGIIEEPDDVRDDNPPSNPELLAYLEKELVSNGYNLKHLKRLIFTSTAYQFSSIPRSEKPEVVANFASYPLRRVEAEVLIDALNEITGSTDLYTSAVPEPFTYIPNSMTAVELADGSISSSFLTLFGRSARATGMENERVSELASPQWLHMLNSGEIQNKLQSGPKLVALVSSSTKPNEIAEKLYLTILSRLPTEADVQAAEEYAKIGVAKGRDVWIDLAWALFNSPEFLLRH